MPSGLVWFSIAAMVLVALVAFAAGWSCRRSRAVRAELEAWGRGFDADCSVAADQPRTSS